MFPQKRTLSKMLKLLASTFVLIFHDLIPKRGFLHNWTKSSDVRAENIQLGNWKWNQIKNKMLMYLYIVSCHFYLTKIFSVDNHILHNILIFIDFAIKDLELNTFHFSMCFLTFTSRTANFCSRFWMLFQQTKYEVKLFGHYFNISNDI